MLFQMSADAASWLMTVMLASMLLSVVATLHWRWR
jgi:hypothetical protein